MGLTDFHGFQDSIRWRLRLSGIETDGVGIERTPGAPGTVTRIWERFSSEINAAAEKYRVPCVLIVATIATESGGNPNALRKEPGYQSDSATPGKISPGLMQTLISTARSAVDNPSIDRDWLMHPANSILAGTAYIAGQGPKTELDPPKTGAAYNAGGVYHQKSRRNRWRMRQYPIGTGEHCDRFIRWFNDAVAVLEAHPLRPVVPYSSLFIGGSPSPPPVVPHSARVIVADNVKRGGRETEALISYMRASGIHCRVTSVVHSKLPSRHAQDGTEGRGLAIDLEGQSPGLDTPQMGEIFKAFEAVEDQLDELIYAGPQVSYNIKGGKRVSKYAVEPDHHNHVHVAVDKGTFIRSPRGRQEDKMQRIVHTTKSDGSTWPGKYITDDIVVGYIATGSRLADLEARFGPSQLMARGDFDQLQKLGPVGWPE